jgi:hypothetical protein
VGHVNTTSCTEIYQYFLDRKNGHLIAEANKLIAQANHTLNPQP